MVPPNQSAETEKPGRLGMIAGDPFRAPSSLWPSSLALALASTLLFACGTPTLTPVEESESDETGKSAEEETTDSCRDDPTPWSYEGERGPESWADLSPCFEACGEASGQSPIDIQGASYQKLSQIRFRYQPAPLRLTHTGRAIELTTDGKSRIDFAEVSYTLESIRLRTPAEHAIRGRHSPMEMQLLHRSSSGQIAAVAVMLEVGEETRSLTEIWEQIPETPGEIVAPEDVSLRTAALLPSTTTSYRYTGSSTQPPCTPDVRWVVLDRPLTITQEQLDRFQSSISSSRRPLQQLGDRQVVTDRGSSSH